VKRHVTGERSVIGPPTCIGELEISREVSLINDDYRSFIRERACSGAVSSRGGVSSAVAASAARRGAVASAAAPSSAACEWNHINHIPSLRLCSRTPSSSSAACSAASTLAACGASSCDTTNSATSCEKPPEEFSTTVQH